MIGILGAGIIGQRLCDHLIFHGQAVKLLSTSLKSNVELRRFRGDITLPETLDKFFEGVDTLVYTSHAGVPKTKESVAREEVKTNVIGALNVLEKIEQHRVRRLVYLSSGGAVYGNPNSDFVNEYHILNPVSPYGISKMMIEQFIKHHHRTVGTKTTLLRPSNVVSDVFMPDGFGVINRVLSCIRSHQAFEVWGDGNGIKDYLSLDDMVLAIKSVIKYSSPEGFEVFNVASGETLSVNEILRVAGAQSSKPLTIKYREAAPQDVPSIVLNGTAFETAYNWKAHQRVADIIEYLARASC